MSVPRLVRHENPEGRETPLLLLASLRELDPEIELVYFGGHDWRLGAVRPTDIRYAAGQRILARQAKLGVRANPKSVMLGHLLTQGFAQIAMYRDYGDPAGEVLDVDLGERCTILANFSRRHFNAINRREETFAAALAESGGKSRKDQAHREFMDKLHTDVRSHFAREVRGRTTFGPGGQTGGRGRMILTPDALRSPADPFPDERPAPRLLTGQDAADYLADVMAELDILTQ